MSCTEAESGQNAAGGWPVARAGSDDILRFLQQLGISYQTCEHPPAFTCEEAERLIPDLPGPRNKNLFLRDFKGRQHYLLVLRSCDQPDLKALAKILDAKSLSLASAERLQKYLATPVGAVSLLSLVNDTGRAVRLLVDRAVWDCGHVLCHPLRHDRTLVFSRASMEVFLRHTGHVPEVMNIPRAAIR